MSTPPLWWDVTMWTAGAAVCAACFVALYRTDPLGVRAWVREWLDNRWEEKHPQELWQPGELRRLTSDLIAERSQPSRARTIENRRRVYRHRLRKKAAGFHGVFPGGPRGALP